MLFFFCLVIQKVTTASLNTLILKGTTRTIKSNSCLARGQLIHRDTLRGSEGLTGRMTGFHLQLQVPVWNWCTVKALAVLISKDRSCSMYLVRLSVWDTFPKVSLGEKVGKISEKKLLSSWDLFPRERHIVHEVHVDATAVSRHNVGLWECKTNLLVLLLPADLSAEEAR